MTQSDWRQTSRSQLDAAIVPRVRGTWKRFATLLWRSRLPIVSLVVLFVVSKYAVDFGLDQTRYTAQIIAGDVSVEVVLLLLAAVLVGWLLSSLASLLRGVIEQIINRNLRRLVWRHLMRLPLAFFGEAPPREAVSRVTTDTNTLGAFIMKQLYPVIVSLYTTYSVAMRLLEYDARLSIAVVSLVPVLILLAWVLGKFQFFAQRDETVRNANLTQRLAEWVSNIPLIKPSASNAERASAVTS